MPGISSRMPYAPQGVKGCDDDLVQCLSYSDYNYDYIDIYYVRSGGDGQYRHTVDGFIERLCRWLTLHGVV